jgi:hypothetical protein
LPTEFFSVVPRALGRIRPASPVCFEGMRVPVSRDLVAEDELVRAFCISLGTFEIDAKRLTHFAG